tara:strand:- start:1496 stop:1780 length:285 start_codon:yes stop_codon:yes gene_type:complete
MASEWLRRFYVTPEWIERMCSLPKGYGIRAIVPQPDRQAILVLLDTPHTDEYLVQEGDVIPQMQTKIIAMPDEHGDEFIRIQVIGVTEEEEGDT